MVDYKEDAECKTKIETREEATASFICPKKHFVRRNGWLVVAKKRKEAVSSRNETDGYIRYFTLCGREAIDVLLFEKEDIIRSNIRGYPDVCYCDYSRDGPMEFAILKEALGKTKGFNKKFEDLVNDRTFVDLIKNEPFDVINLDFCGSCFPKYDAPDSATLRAIERLLQLQSGISFDLFVTFRARRSEDNSEAIHELEAAMDRNFNDFNKIQVAYNDSVGRPLNDLSVDDYPYFLLTTVPKVILGFAVNSGLNGKCRCRFCYGRRKKIDENKFLTYKIIKFIFSFDSKQNNNGHFSERSRWGVEIAGEYPTTIINYLKHNPINVEDVVVHDQALQYALNGEQEDLRENRKKFKI